MKYGAAAKEAGCFITTAVGFDCIPADVGAAIACSTMLDSGLQPHTVDSFLVLDWGPAGSCGHFATLCAPPHTARALFPAKLDRVCVHVAVRACLGTNTNQGAPVQSVCLDIQLVSRLCCAVCIDGVCLCRESAVHGFRNTSKLKAARRDAKAAGLNPSPQIDGPKPRRMRPCEYMPSLGYAIPFPGADASVVRRTMSARGGAGLPVVYYLASFVIRQRWNLWMLMLFGGAVQLLSRTAIGAALILRWPKLLTCGAFSKAGPTQKQMDGTTFSMIHHGYAFDSATDLVEEKVRQCLAQFFTVFC